MSLPITCNCAGQRSFQIFERTIKSAQIIEFLKHLLRYVPGDILLIWDRLPAHRSLVTQEFIRDQQGRLTVEYLPPYAPELNPVENVWQYLRQNFLSNRVFDSYDAIVDACCQAWNALMALSSRLRSITERDWAKTVKA